MNINRILSCVVPVVLVVLAGLGLGCAGSADTESTADIMARWVGRDVNRLITAWGPPTSTFVMPNKNTMYTWATSMEKHIEDAYGLAALLADPDTRISTRWCKQWFVVTPGGTIVDWDYEGNDCGD